MKSLCADPEGWGDRPVPLKNHKIIGFSSNTGPDPLKNHKHSMLGHHRHASKTPFNGISLEGR